MAIKIIESKPCPQCGGKGITDKFYTILHTDIVPFKWAVICEDCNFIASAKGTKQAAIRAWNRM